MSNPKPCAWFALAAVLLAAAASAEPAYNVCEAQTRHDVTDRLGLTVKDIVFRWSHEDLRGFVEPSQALVYVEECPGFYFYELLGTFETCVALAHYGAPPSYIFYRGPNAGCGTP